MYTPPFTVSAKAINLIAEISAQIERYSIRMEQNDSLRLRKANRIKTVHSSLAIEGNTLVEHQGKSLHEIGEEYNLSESEIQALGHIRADKRITAVKLSEKIGLKPRQAERILSSLKSMGIIRRDGAKRNGVWVILV